AGVQDHAFTEHCAVPDACTLGHHAATSDHGVVADEHRCGLRWFQYAADADAAGEVDVGADLRARADCRPRVDHRVGPDAGSDVHVTGHEDDTARQVG